VRVCVFVCLCVCVRASQCVRARKRVCVYVCARKSTRARVRVCVCTGTDGDGLVPGHVHAQLVTELGEGVGMFAQGCGH